MVHQLPTNEKESKRISSLEQRVEELEYTFLRTANTLLEARVAELEISLKESNEERDKLRKLLAETEITERKDVSDFDVENVCEDICEEVCEDIGSDRLDDSSENSKILKNFGDKEFERVYGRILKLVNNMKSECTKAIHSKIPTSSLPKFGSPKFSSPFGSSPFGSSPFGSSPFGSSPLGSSPFGSSPFGSPKTPPASPFTPMSSKMPVHSRTSSMSATFISSRPNTPSSIKSSSIPSSPITPPARLPAPLKIQNLPSPSSIPNTPTSTRSPTTPVNSLSSPAIQQSLRMLSRSRTPSLTNLASSFTYDSSIPSPLGSQSSQSGLAQKSTNTSTLLMHDRAKNRYSQNYSNLAQSTASSQAIKV
ncbi:15575_t:CDS:1 [Racocetra persica]|uniref:15575_t:CDS:1 n=1 Tax=Racocetra persica TaxID=160502 RepID=A0ACA9KG47_9GLOM|nr:15575_t:CDS:1 [Racocetra persica]